MATRTVTWWESRYDQGFIVKNNWQYNIAKSVLSATNSADTSYNVIWKSLGAGPQFDITWGVTYGLNWTADLPVDGATVVAGGDWQECDKGAAYDLNTEGYWDPSSSGQDGWMTVGQVNYKYPGVDGIHIIVGVKNGKNWETIYIDPTSLPPGSSGSYQPQEKCKWWLSSPLNTGSVYSKTSGRVGGVDFTDPAPSTNKYAWWTTYLHDSGTWVNSQTAPDSSVTAPVKSEHFTLFPKQMNGNGDSLGGSMEVVPWPLIRNVAFTVAIATGLQTAAATYIKGDLLKNFTKVEVEWKDPASGKTLNVKWGNPKSARPGSLASIGVLTGTSTDPNEPLTSALIDAKTAQKLPGNESWSISNA